MLICIVELGKRFTGLDFFKAIFYYYIGDIYGN